MSVVGLGGVDSNVDEYARLVTQEALVGPVGEKKKKSGNKVLWTWWKKGYKNKNKSLPKDIRLR